jgi:hypothetical protein
MALAFETVYGTPPASGYRLMPFVGILTGPDTFLHAYERLGVIEELLTPAWRRRIAFAFLFPAR